MELHIANHGPVVVADDLFTYKEYKLMFDEFKRIKERGLLMSGNETGGAINQEDGSMLKKNSSVFLDYLYTERSLSDILTTNRKIFYPSILSELIKQHSLFNYIQLSNSDSTLLSYYDSGNKYEEHRDMATVTVLTWFYEEPKKFEGGDFIVENDLKIECRANRTVFMPSYMLHAVTPVKAEKPNKGLGRYTMTQFIHVGT